MKKILVLAIIALVVIITASTVFAINMHAMKLPAITSANKLEYKTMLKSYLNPVFDGYGIGINGDNYITAKWHISHLKTLSFGEIKNIINNTNSTNWSELKEEIQNAIQSEGNTTTKGRIKIGNTTYLLTNIQITNTTASADIRNMPDYNACKQSNTSAENCESSTTKVGDLSLAKKTNAINTDDKSRVWAGTLNFNSIAYTFLAFAFPRW